MRALPHGAVADALATVRASLAAVTTKDAFEFLVLTAARSRRSAPGGRGTKWTWTRPCGPSPPRA